MSMSIEDHLKRIKYIQEELEKEHQKRLIEYNGKDCREGCNCALIHCELNGIKKDELKTGFLCLKPCESKIIEDISQDELDLKAEAVKNYFNKKL